MKFVKNLIQALPVTRLIMRTALFHFKINKSLRIYKTQWIKDRRNKSPNQERPAKAWNQSIKMFKYTWNLKVLNLTIKRRKTKIKKLKIITQKTSQFSISEDKILWEDQDKNSRQYLKVKEKEGHEELTLIFEIDCKGFFWIIWLCYLVIIYYLKRCVTIV
jgi:hypothetical protein